MELGTLKALNSDCGIDGIGQEVRFQACAGLFSLLHSITTGSESHSVCIFRGAA